ncbi:MAG: isoprenylcysteine carboxylmethyltransferase family protein [Archangiaceae bacterium]|nr:isoprenylcysteine carboxylmethyltransferase family protein [Archangiaceae bacterium]
MWAARRLVVACVGVLGPFVLAPERLRHPAPWLLLAVAAVIQLTLPRASAADLGAAEDAGSARLILIVANLVVLVPVLDFVLRPALSPPPLSGWTFVGAAALSAGAVLRLWAIRVLGAFFTGVVHTSDGQSLIERGPYRLLRHPSYSGVLLGFIGEAVLFRSALGLALTLGAMLPVYLYRIRVEERALGRRFAAEWPAYRRRTWALCPWVY